MSKVLFTLTFNNLYSILVLVGLLLVTIVSRLIKKTSQQPISLTKKDIPITSLSILLLIAAIFVLLIPRQTVKSGFPYANILAIITLGATFIIQKILTLASREIPVEKLDSKQEKAIITINSVASIATTLLTLAACTPIAFKIFSISFLPVKSYGFMLTLAFVAAIYTAERQAKKSNQISNRDMIFLCIALILSALIGSKLFFHIFEQPPSSPLDLIAIWRGGLVIYGGIITASITAFIIIVKRGLGLGRVFDIFAPALAIGIFFGRLGCYLSGCCYGAPTNAFCGQIFPNTAHVYQKLKTIVSMPDQYPTAFHKIPANLISLIKGGHFHQVPVHPTQLYSALNGLLLFFLLLLFAKKKKFEGELFLWMICYYAITRFLIELLRIDTPNSFLFGLSAAQSTSLLLLPIAVIIIIIKHIKQKKSPATDESK